MTPSAALNIPPGPRVPKPLAGAMALMNRGALMERMGRRYGDTFTLDLPALGRSTVVAHPDLVKKVFTAKPDVLAFGEDSPLGRILGPGSLFSLDGDEHLRERRLLLPPFHGERMKSYVAIIEEETRRELATWPEATPFATLDSFMRITLNAILRAVFGAQGEHQRRLAELLPRAVELGSKLALAPWAQRDLGPWSPGGKFVRYRRAYDEVIDALIDEALADPALDERADVLALLLRAHYDDGSAMSRTQISDELLTLLAAGHETTATTLAWAVERLRRHPALVARLAAEARDGGSALRTATVHEVQRTRPVIVATSRVVVGDRFELDEWVFPRGHRIVVSASMIHADERFFERPKAFDPDRFLERKPDTYTWVPFGGGTRRCIGAAFAQMEMDVVLRILLEDFDLGASEDRGERWRSRGIAAAPADGGIAVVRRVAAPAPARDLAIAAAG
jgi:cytochrome P450